MKAAKFDRLLKANVAEQSANVDTPAHIIIHQLCSEGRSPVSFAAAAPSPPLAIMHRLTKRKAWKVPIMGHPPSSSTRLDFRATRSMITTVDKNMIHRLTRLQAKSERRMPAHAQKQ